ncbi:MAG: hypothetical protein FWE19_07290 [Oscillospiraceae bacterium]|nr:hypothetical protein [Oscillospiraceae bacterium]
MSANREELLSRLVRDYAEMEGALLRQELAAESAPTPGLDKKVRKGLFKLKYKVCFRVAGTVAACLALALLLPPILQQPGPGTIVPAPQMSAPAAPAPASGAMPEVEAEFFAGGLARIDGSFDEYVVFSDEPSAAIEWHTEQLPPEPVLPFPQGGYIAPFAAGGLVDEAGIDIEIPPWVIRPLDPAMLSFELPEGFYLTSYSLESYEFYVIDHDQYRQIFLTVLPNDELERFIENEDIGQMQLGGYAVYYLYFPNVSSFVALEKNNNLYLLNGSQYSTLEALLLLADAIIAG